MEWTDYGILPDISMKQRTLASCSKEKPKCRKKVKTMGISHDLSISLASLQNSINILIHETNTSSNRAIPISIANSCSDNNSIQTKNDYQRHPSLKLITVPRTLQNEESGSRGSCHKEIIASDTNTMSNLLKPLSHASRHCMNFIPLRRPHSHSHRCQSGQSSWGSDEESQQHITPSHSDATTIGPSEDDRKSSGRTDDTVKVTSSYNVPLSIKHDRSLSLKCKASISLKDGIGTINRGTNKLPLRPSFSDQISKISDTVTTVTRSLRPEQSYHRPGTESGVDPRPLLAALVGSFKIGTISCKSPSMVSFYRNRLEYLFRHPHDCCEVLMVMFYKDFISPSFKHSGLTLGSEVGSGGKFSFGLSDKMVCFWNEFDPQNPWHRISMDLFSSAHALVFKDKVWPLVRSMMKNPSSADS